MRRAERRRDAGRGGMIVRVPKHQRLVLCCSRWSR